MDDSRLGLYRLMDCAQQERVKRELGVCFADLYDALDDVRDLSRELEHAMDRIFHGEKSNR